MSSNINSVYTVLHWLLFICFHLEGINCEEEINNIEDTASNLLTIRIYNRKNKNGTVIRDDAASLFVAGLPLVVVTHGWKRSALTPSVLDIVHGYQNSFDFNIFTVDWESIAAGDYYSASYGTGKVGRAVGDLVVHLYRDRLCTMNDTHLIGHSLGAHVMGVAGNQIEVTIGQKVGRISGLDPAGPLFEYVTSNKTTSLDPSDAEFVDVIHSDQIFGSIEPLGHADFYPNGGLPPQPGCNLSDLWCSHKRAFQYYSESIGNRSAFLARECSSYKSYVLNMCSGETARMGHWTPWSTRGTFYLTTSGSSPYSI